MRRRHPQTAGGWCAWCDKRGAPTASSPSRMLTGGTCTHLPLCWCRAPARCRPLRSGPKSDVKSEHTIVCACSCTLRWTAHHVRHVLMSAAPSRPVRAQCCFVVSARRVRFGIGDRCVHRESRAHRRGDLSKWNTTDLVPITSRHESPVGALSATATGVPASVFAEIGPKRDGSGRDISQSNAR